MSSGIVLYNNHSYTVVHLRSSRVDLQLPTLHTLQQFTLVSRRVSPSSPKDSTSSYTVLHTLPPKNTDLKKSDSCTETA